MVGLFYIYLPMSWSIPQQIEKDIIAGKAKYQTFQTGNGGQSILPVPPNSYVVIFGYDFSPAGGGIKDFSNSTGNFPSVTNINVRVFETQQISFYTGTDFFPFIHHCDVKSVLAPFEIDAALLDNNIVKNYKILEEIDSTPIARQVYITSTNDVTITHGLILNAIRATSGVIPITSRTPLGLTYGGSGQAVQSQTNYGPLVTPLQFLQPSPKDFQDFALGLIPANADGQSFATPDATNGLRESADYVATVIGLGSSACAAYYLCLHYALYSAAIPETRG
jgi:hypothetical protein